MQDEYLCVAKFLPVRGWMNVIPFLQMSSRIQEQLGRSEGVVRYGVRTDIPRKRFWTLSVWTDEKLMRAFVETEPHLTAIRSSSPGLEKERALSNAPAQRGR